MTHTATNEQPAAQTANGTQAGSGWSASPCTALPLAWYRQHLLRSILPLRESGLTLEDGSKVRIEPLLVDRNEAKIRELAHLQKVEHRTTDLDAVIAGPAVDVVFDASRTSRRAATLKKARSNGKHIFTEKPTAETLEEARELARIGKAAGIPAGVAHDKLYLPGLVKLRRLVDEGFFGRIPSIRTSTTRAVRPLRGKRSTHEHL